MSHQSRPGLQSRRFGTFAASVTIIAVLLAYGPVTTWVSGQPAAANKNAPAMMLASLGFKFNGAGSCKGSGCHDKEGDDAPPKEIGHEFNIWKEQDKHAKAYETLSSKESKDIGTKMSIADVKASDKCLSCHALAVPQNLQIGKFNIKEGNTCESCHGPSEKWLKDHAVKGWQDKQRAAMSHEQLVKTIGLYDTRPLVVRAELCASCHLSIDPAMVKAGHPIPSFELAYYSDIEPKHWFEKHGKPDGYVNTKVWMAGQVICVREAMQQLADRAKAKAGDDAVGTAWQQALAHASVFSPAAKVAGIAGIDEGIAALSALKAADVDKIAPAAEAVAKACEAGKAKIDAWDPDANAAVTAQLLGAVSSMSGLGTKFGQFGVDQQSMGISSLYSAWSSGTGKKDAAMDKLITDKLFPETPLKPADLDKAVADVKAKLPK